ncbi:hypothetical protein, partial [Rhodopseudomonas palustris]|uniref:hypothetical protein n=1 Tax=Rhodopseudomonas palustris TaxID=1076 RepID=UPI001AEBFFDB
ASSQQLLAMTASKASFVIALGQALSSQRGSLIDRQMFGWILILLDFEIFLDFERSHDCGPSRSGLIIAASRSSHIEDQPGDHQHCRQRQHMRHRLRGELFGGGNLFGGILHSILLEIRNGPDLSDSGAPWSLV